MRAFTGVTITAAAVALTASVAAQQQERSFEVASVRLTAPQTRSSRTYTNTRVDLTNISLLALLTRAFQLNGPSPWLAAPNWVNGVSVDIHATLPPGSAREHIPEMLRTLLVTRFGLRTHVEPRPMDAYVLVVGTGGVRLEEVAAINELDTVFRPKEVSIPRCSRQPAIPEASRRVRVRSSSQSSRGMKRFLPIEAHRCSMPRGSRCASSRNCCP